jgi:hypothetical protein
MKTLILEIDDDVHPKIKHFLELVAKKSVSADR